MCRAEVVDIRAEVGTGRVVVNEVKVRGETGRAKRHALSLCSFCGRSVCWGGIGAACGVVDPAVLVVVWGDRRVPFDFAQGRLSPRLWRGSG